MLSPALNSIKLVSSVKNLLVKLHPVHLWLCLVYIVIILSFLSFNMEKRELAFKFCWKKTCTPAHTYFVTAMWLIDLLSIFTQPSLHMLWCRFCHSLSCSKAKDSKNVGKLTIFLIGFVQKQLNWFPLFIHSFFNLQFWNFTLYPYTITLLNIFELIISERSCCKYKCCYNETE